MTEPDRSTIRLRLIGADFPDGEIPLDHLAAISSATQQLATRLARAAEDRGGAGRSSRRIEEGVRLLFVGIESGSTGLLFAAPPDAPRLDLGGPSDAAVDRALDRIADGVEADGELPGPFDGPAADALRDWFESVGAAAREAEIEVGVRSSPARRVRFDPSERLAALEPRPETRRPITVEGVLYAVNLHSRRFIVEDDLGASLAVVVPEAVEHRAALLLDQRVRVEGVGEYLADGKLRSVVANVVRPAVSAIDSSPFWESDTPELLAGSPSPPSLDELAVPGLTESDAERFLRTIGQ